MKLVLFDIDGTLVDMGGAGTRSLNKAFKEVLFMENALESVSLAGKTDPQIVSEIFAYHNREEKEEIAQRILDVYLSHLKQEVHRTNKRLQPGILPLLKSLAPIAMVGLLSGNIEEGARIKLESFGIHHFFKGGAFGSDHPDRDELLPIAKDRFSSFYGIPIAMEDCIVIGDTPRDVSCAKPHGAMALAVATGPYPARELSATDADLVLNDLSETDVVLDFIQKR